MAEQKSYMQQLDDWTNSHVIAPLIRVYDSEEAQGLSSEEAERRQSEVFAQVEKAIREKVLESYRNGQAAGPAKRFYRKPKEK